MVAIQGDTGDYAWIMASTALVFMMIPGIALFYSGVRSQGTALSLIWLNMMAVSIVSIQWYLLGYSLVYSKNDASTFIGNFRNGAFLRMSAQDEFADVHSERIPGMVFGLFQSMFAAFTVALITGVIAEKGRLLPFIVFSLLWTTLVYDPIAYWTWNAGGWAAKLGTLDWAGGTPVHISSGAASLAYAIALRHLRVHGPAEEIWDNMWNNIRTGVGAAQNASPPRVAPQERDLNSHNMTNALVGTLLVWFGWFGFNAGSELHANERAASTFISTNLAATSGALTWVFIERAAGETWSGLGLCSGAFAGLVAVTPAAGYVQPWAGLVIGVTASAVCYIPSYWEGLSVYLEEPLEIFIIHGIGGVWGMLMTGIFADKALALLDGDTTMLGGCINGHGKQMLYQMAGGFAGFAWSFFITLFIIVIMQIFSIFIPGLALRARQIGTERVRIDAQLHDVGAYQITCRHHQVTGGGVNRQPTGGSGFGRRSSSGAASSGEAHEMEPMPSQFPLGPNGTAGTIPARAPGGGVGLLRGAAGGGVRSPHQQYVPVPGPSSPATPPARHIEV